MYVEKIHNSKKCIKIFAIFFIDIKLIWNHHNYENSERGNISFSFNFIAYFFRIAC